MLCGVFVLICRCVPEQHRSFALGIQWMLFRTLGKSTGHSHTGWTFIV